MMNDKSVIPVTYKEWRYCIEIVGEVKLTPTYIEERLATLQDTQRAETKTFAKLYGEEHLQRTVDWFRRAASELT